MKKLTLAAAVAASMAQMAAYALTEVSGDYTITSTTFSVLLVFTGDANLTIAENVGSSTTLGVFLGTVTNDGHNVTINMESGCKAQVNWFQNLNGATTKINFKGGRFTDGGGRG